MPDSPAESEKSFPALREVPKENPFVQKETNIDVLKVMMTERS